MSAPQLRAQSDDSQSSSQDVAEAARQERARKQNSSSKHVYTNEDLHRSKILTPEDQGRAAAAKQKQQPPASAAKPEVQPLDANSVTPQEPLGDVARRYRNARRVGEKKSPFHLPSEQPQLAVPKILPSTPQSAAKPSPKILLPASPVMPGVHGSNPIAPPSLSVPKHRVDPFARPRFQPAAPLLSPVAPVGPRASVSSNSPTSRPRVTTSAAPPHSVVVQKGDTLWSLSRQHLGKGTRWLELMAANPNLPDPGKLVPGTVLSVPAKASSSRSNRSMSKVTVRTGDTLTKLALRAYGHASAWPCIAAANPSLSNPHLLATGQILNLPASCRI